MNFERQGKSILKVVPPPTNAGDVRARRFVFEQDVMEVTKLFERIFHKETNEKLWRWKYLPPWTDEAYSWVASMDGQIAGRTQVDSDGVQVDLQVVDDYLVVYANSGKLAVYNLIEKPSGFFSWF